MSYSAEEMRAMRKRGGDQTDLARVDAMTKEKLDAAIAPDPDEAGVHDGPAIWVTGMPDRPGLKQQLTIRLDQDVAEWFKATGKGYQTRMNAVLGQFVEAQKKAS